MIIFLKKNFHNSKEVSDFFINFVPLEQKKRVGNLLLLSGHTEAGIELYNVWLKPDMTAVKPGNLTPIYL